LGPHGEFTRKTAIPKNNIGFDGNFKIYLKKGV